MDTTIPLVVDLDGTLLSSDLLDESISRFITASPFRLPLLPWWLLKGRLTLKTRVAERTTLDLAALPYNTKLIEWLSTQADAGRQVVLASASEDRLVQQIAEHLGIFDLALGSKNGVNLKGSAKAAALVERYGERGFDYVGNHHDDLKVWSHARVGHLVDPRGDLAKRAAEVTTVGESFGSRSHQPIRQLIRAARPHQWAKNALLFVPLLTAQKLNHLSADLHALLAFATFCLVASGVYLLNDIADVENDRHHATKRRRPFASGRLRLTTGWLVWPLLTGTAFALSIALMPWYYTLSLAGYLMLTIAYTFWLKGQAVVDVVALGGLYTARVLAGAAAVSVPVSFWLITFSMFFFLSLALIKRVSELTRLRETMAVGKGRGYQHSDLELLASYGVSSSMAACVILAIYFNSLTATGLYEHPDILWAALPIMMAWLMRMWLLSHRGQMTEDPVLFASRDLASILAVTGIVAAFVAAKF